MSIPARLRDERLRLGLSQSAFAALAGVTKSAQVKWERESSSSPTAPALAAFAAAGADVIYILTGTRQAERRADALSEIHDELEIARREILDPSALALADETEEATEKRVLQRRANVLTSILAHDAKLLTPEMAKEARDLLEMIGDPSRLNAARREANLAQRAKRDQAKRRLSDWFHEDDYLPNDAAMYMLVTLASEYGVPVKVLSHLVEELKADFERSE